MKYYSFRYSEFYGGIATAFCSECNFNCVFCYSDNKRDTGKQRDARFVANKLIKLAKKHEIKNCRISGGEPTIYMEHLLEVINIIMDESDLTFWLETNGLIIGQNPELASKLAKFPKDRLMITVSLKHTVPKFFAKLTQTHNDEWCKYPMKAFEDLTQNDCSTRIAFMHDWYSNDEIENIGYWVYKVLIEDKKLKFKTAEDREDYIDSILDIEEFRKYPSVPLKKKEIKDLLRE